jgi:hypothetical protein
VLRLLGEIAVYALAALGVGMAVAVAFAIYVYRKWALGE